VHIRSPAKKFIPILVVKTRDRDCDAKKGRDTENHRGFCVVSEDTLCTGRARAIGEACAQKWEFVDASLPNGRRSIR